jgi:hypothetical protein
MDLDAVFRVDALLRQGSLVWMYPDILMVLLHAGVDRTASMPNADLDHSQGIMYTTSVLSPRSFLTIRMKCNGMLKYNIVIRMKRKAFLGRRPTY